MDEKIMNLATAEEIDINNIELVSDDELQEGLRKAFGALSAEEERKEGKRVIINYMRENQLKQMEFEDPDSGITKLARYFPERKSLVFDSSILKSKYPEIYKECLVEKTKTENLWISKSKHSKK